MEGFLENLYNHALERWCEMRVIVGAAVYPSREDITIAQPTPVCPCAGVFRSDEA